MLSKQAHRHQIERQEDSQPDGAPLGQRIEEFVVGMAIPLRHLGMNDPLLPQCQHALPIAVLSPAGQRLLQAKPAGALPHLEACAERTRATLPADIALNILERLVYPRLDTRLGEGVYQRRSA